MKKITQKSKWEKMPITSLIVLLGILGILALFADAFFGTTIAGLSISSTTLPTWALFWVIALGIVYNLEK